MNKKISLASDSVSREDINLLIDWLSQEPMPRLTKGDQTLIFEEAFAKYIGSKYCIHVNSGSAAILLTLYALIQGKYIKNKKVIVPSLSWLTDVSSCMQLGLEPILCDSNIHDLSVDLNHLEQLFKEHKPSTLILVSVLGLVPNMDAIIRLCNKYEVILLEDICESLGSEYKGQRLGNFGLASMCSGYFSHQISCGGESGMITTNDKHFYELLISIRSHGMVRDNTAEVQNKLLTEWNINEFDALYSFFYPGFNERSNNISAFFGIQQLKKVDNFISIRNQNFKHYQNYIKVNDLKLDDKSTNFISSFAYPIVSKNKARIVKNLQDNNIEVRPLIAGSMGRQPFWIKEYGVCELKNCDRIHKDGFYLPNHQDITEDDIKIISSIVNNS
jgi:CDP-6-deoxy-D-xylo-4-hexulose-3-dehydrase